MLEGLDSGHLEHSVSLGGAPTLTPPAELTLDSASAALALRDAAPGAAPSPPPAPGSAADGTTSGAPAASPFTPAVDDQSSILREPREVLQSFLAAPDWESRLQFVQHREAVAPLMKAYYADNPDGPVAANSISFQNSDRVPNGDFLFYLFHITTEAVPEGFPVSVEESADGFKVDWRTFVEFNDQQLFRFLSNPGLEDARAFHVIMRRTHYFGSDVPDLGQKYAFRIEPPIPGVHGYAFVERDSPLATEKLNYQLQWPAVSYPVVKLQWTGPPNGPRYIEVVDLVQNNWRSDPVGVPGNVAEVPSE